MASLTIDLGGWCPNGHPVRVALAATSCPLVSRERCPECGATVEVERLIRDVHPTTGLPVPQRKD